METTSTVRTKPASAFKAVALMGFIAGALDIAAATIASGASFTSVLKYIASGFFGRETAFAGGLEMAFWGLLFHFFIAYSWTILYFLIYPKVPFLSKHRIVSGLLYGVVIWAGMNRVVIPVLSQINQPPFNPLNALKSAAILSVAIGLPVSFLTHRFYSKR